MEVKDDTRKYPYAYPGVVIDNVDPRGWKRCRLRVQGIAEETAWARPMTLGGGSPQRGGAVTPAIGADVVVWFLFGDIERPTFMCGHWSERDNAPEMPLPTRDVPKAEAHLVQMLQLGNLVLSVDERPGNRKMVIEDTVTEDAIVWDLEKQGLRIKMTSAVIIEADGLVRTNGAQVTTQDRLVQIDPKPI